MSQKQPFLAFEDLDPAHLNPDNLVYGSIVNLMNGDPKPATKMSTSDGKEVVAFYIEIPNDQAILFLPMKVDWGRNTIANYSESPFIVVDITFIDSWSPVTATIEHVYYRTFLQFMDEFTPGEMTKASMQAWEEYLNDRVDHSEEVVRKHAGSFKQAGGPTIGEVLGDAFDESAAVEEFLDKMEAEGVDEAGLDEYDPEKVIKKRTTH